MAGHVKSVGFQKHCPMNENESARRRKWREWPCVVAVIALLGAFLAIAMLWPRGRAADILSQIATKPGADWLSKRTGSLHRETNAHARVRLAKAIGRMDSNASEISTILQRALNHPSLRKLATEGPGGVAEQERQPINPRENGKDK